MNAKEQGFLQVDKQQIDIGIPDGVVVTSVAFKTQIDSTKALEHESLENLIKQVEARAAEYSVAHRQFSLTDNMDIECISKLKDLRTPKEDYTRAVRIEKGSS